MPPPERGTPSFDELVERLKKVEEKLDERPSVLAELRREPSDPVETLLPHSVTPDLLSEGYIPAPAPPVAVTGSRGGNAALADLLTLLDALGWIDDTSTA